jgi:hypothetical protein
MSSGLKEFFRREILPRACIVLDLSVIMARTFSQQSECSPRAENLADLRVKASFDIAAGFKLVGTLFARRTLERQK